MFTRSRTRNYIHRLGVYGGIKRHHNSKQSIYLFKTQLTNFHRTSLTNNYWRNIFMLIIINLKRSGNVKRLTIAAKKTTKKTHWSYMVMKCISMLIVSKRYVAINVNFYPPSIYHLLDIKYVKPLLISGLQIYFLHDLSSETVQF